MCRILLSRTLTIVLNIFSADLTELAQSNLIESKNRMVKRYLKHFGLKNVYQADYLDGTNFYTKGDLEECPRIEGTINYSTITLLVLSNK